MKCCPLIAAAWSSVDALRINAHHLPGMPFKMFAKLWSVDTAPAEDRRQPGSVVLTKVFVGSIVAGPPDLCDQPPRQASGRKPTVAIVVNAVGNLFVRTAQCASTW